MMDDDIEMKSENAPVRSQIVAIKWTWSEADTSFKKVKRLI